MCIYIYSEPHVWNRFVKHIRLSNMSRGQEKWHDECRNLLACRTWQYTAKVRRSRYITGHFAAGGLAETSRLNIVKNGRCADAADLEMLNQPVDRGFHREILAACGILRYRGHVLGPALASDLVDHWWFWRAMIFWIFHMMKMQTGEISWGYTLWLFNIAMGNGPFIEVYRLPIKNGDFPWLC